MDGTHILLWPGILVRIRTHYHPWIMASVVWPPNLPMDGARWGSMNGNGWGIEEALTNLCGIAGEYNA